MSSADPLATLWQEAIRKFEKDHDYPISNRSLILTPSAILNDTRFQFETARSKHKKLITAFEPFYDTLRSVSQVIGHGLKLVYPPAEAITAAVIVLIDGVQKTSQSYDAIADMLDDLRYLLERYRGYTANTDSTELRSLVVDGLVHTLHIISLSTKAAEQGRFRTFLKTLIHKDKNILEAMHKLDKLSIRESHSVGVASFSATNEILKISKESRKLNRDHSQTVQSILTKISEIATRCTDLQLQSKSNQTLLEELQALATPVSEALRKQQLEKLNRHATFSVEHDPCLPGTRPDILQTIHDWVDDRDATNIFWLYGHPGTGKSTIATTVCHNLARERRLGAVCFFRRDDAASHTPKSVWRSIAYDLADKHGFLASSIIMKLEDNQVDIDHSSPFDILKVLILDTLEQSADGFNDSLVVIIDALDEFGGLDQLNQPQRDLLQTLVASWKKLPSCFKLFITSRDQGFISRYLSADSSQCVSLRVGEAATAQSSADIRTFLMTKFGDIASRPSFISRAAWRVCEADISDLVKAAAGLFIWASTVVRMVTHRPTILQHILAQVRGSVGNGTALDGLGQLYSTILKSAYDDFGDDDLVNLVVGSLITGHVPLSCGSLAGLLDVEFDDVATISGKLQPVLDSSSSALHFVHKSFVDYVVSLSCPDRFRCDLRVQMEKMFLACFSTMTRELHFNMGSMKTSHHLNQDYPEMYVLISAHLNYGCRFWASHLPTGPSLLGEIHKQAVTVFLDNHLLFWLEVLSILECFADASTSMSSLSSCLKATNSTVMTQARDALLFIQTFTSPMSQSYPHIYLSALAFAPTSSITRKTYIKFFPWLLGVSHGLSAWQSQLRIFRDDEGGMSSVSLSPDGTCLVVGHNSGTIHLLDAVTHKLIGKPLEGCASVDSAAFSQDGTHIVSSHVDGTVRIWDATTHRPIGKVLGSFEDQRKSVAISPDATRVIFGPCNTAIMVWDTKTQQTIGKLFDGHESFVSCLAFSPHGGIIASGSHDNTIRLWDTETFQPIGKPLRGHEGTVLSVVFSRDDAYIASMSHDSTIRLWNTSTQAPIGDPLCGHQNTVRSVAFSSDGTRIVSGSDDFTIRVWDTATLQPIGQPLKCHGGYVNFVAFSPDGMTIVSSSFEEGSICIWDAETQYANSEPVNGRYEPIPYSVAFSPDGNCIVSGESHSSIRLWDAATQQPIGEPLRGHKGQVESVSFSADGTRLVSGSSDDTVRLWNTETHEPIGKPLQGHKGNVLFVSISPDGTRIVSGALDRTIRLWDVSTHDPTGVLLYGHKYRPDSISFSPDGRWIVSGSRDGTICLWDVTVLESTGQRPSQHMTAFAFTTRRRCIYDLEDRRTEDETLPDYSDLASVPALVLGYRNLSSISDRTLLFLVAKTSWLSIGIEGSVLDISPDGTRIASGSLSMNGPPIQLWDTRTCQKIGGPLHGHQLWVTSVAFSPDATRVASGSEDGTVRLWDATSHDVMTSTSTRPDLKTMMPNSGSPDLPSPLSLLEDDWVIGSLGERLFWLPPPLHDSIQTVGLLGIMGRPMSTLDLSRFVHGESWTSCYVPSGSNA